jgi:hypothetical protein
MYTYHALTALACAVSAILPCAALYTQKNTSITPGFSLLPGIESVPAPVSVAPDQVWQGVDGSWNGFSLRVGSQQQRISVLVSTNSQQVWVVDKTACVSNETKVLDNNCKSSRGSLFDRNQSSTWQEQGFYGLWTGRNLGIDRNGLYGYDTVSMGLPGEEGPSVSSSLMATIITSDFWRGQMGLHSKQTNFTDLPPVPSYITRLFEQGSIPSVSFGYTAGSQYRMFSCAQIHLTLIDLTDEPVFLASLTLGGYDASRFVPNNSSFVFAPDNDRDLVVNVAAMTADTSTTSNIDLVRTANFSVLIDSTVAELWLPIWVCEAFEKEFGLVYDRNTGLYLVDDNLHESLLARNPSITITLGQPFHTNETVQITLPYAAFDLEAKPPYGGLNATSKYFPIRRGSNESQWVLGRTFLQEAYLSVDWERERFSVYPVDWTYGAAAALSPIVSPKYAQVYIAIAEDTGLSTGAIAGIAVGAALFGVLAVVTLYWWLGRRHQKAAKARYEAMGGASQDGDVGAMGGPRLTSSVEKATSVFPKAELPGNSDVYRGEKEREKEGIGLYEVDNTERPVYEMMGDVPSTPEAGGRQLSEKESMMVREKEINGVDPNGTNETLASPEAVHRPAGLLRLDDIAMVDGRLPVNVSPITPRTPGTPGTPRDGAQLEAGDRFFRAVPEGGARGRRFGVEAGLVSPISPMFPPIATEERRRFSYES